MTPQEGWVVFCTSCDAEIISVYGETGTFFIYQNGYWKSFKPCNVVNPYPSTHLTSTSQITWNWLPVTGVKGYRFNSVNDYETAQDLGNITSKFERDLTPATTYNRFVWSYKDCGYSQSVLLTQKTLSAYVPGTPVTINHLASRGVAPIDKTITYNTVVLPQTPNIAWITKNLGAEQQAISASDKNIKSAGWYFQFNNKRGFGATIDSSGKTHITPSSSWNGVQYTESSDWKEENDPITIEFGVGWRLPTKEEWLAIDVWGIGSAAYTSPLKLHYGCGWLYPSDGHLNQNSSYFWSRTQVINSRGICAVDMSSTFSTTSMEKNSGFVIRGVKDLNR
jgi:hypothetical protein